jgi:N-6 DNA Methylase
MPSASTETARDRLASRVRQAALDLSEFGAALDEAAQEISSAIGDDDSEATVAGVFERVLYAELKSIGLRFHPLKEQAVEGERHRGVGRTDSRLGSLVFEYKRPARLKTAAQVKAGMGQLGDYLCSLTEMEGTAIGILTDGRRMVEIYARDGEIESETPPMAVDEAALRRIALHINSIHLTALTAENLLRDLCGTEGSLYRAAKSFRTALTEGPSNRTQMLFEEWRAMYRLGHKDKSQQRRIEQRRAALSEIFNERFSSAEDEYQALFCLHTSYAVVLKLMAVRVLSQVAFERNIGSWSSVLRMDSNALRPHFAGLEDGSTFRKLGILNLLEGDFFSWYCDQDQWSDEIASGVEDLMRVLARYETTRDVFGEESAIDLFRKLYEAAVPQAIRSSFGEFHTPKWLAEDILRVADYRPTDRLLDPCSGSGTLLISAIDRIREATRLLSDEEQLHAVLTNVVGIDLNPLSVLMSRINYFIQIADLIPENSEGLVIPVFLGDASDVPQLVDVDGTACIRYSLRTLRDLVQVVLPRSLVGDTAAFVKLMHEFESAIRESSRSRAEAVILGRLGDEEKTQGIEEGVAEFCTRLIELHGDGWDGIWARIITNFLSTAALEPFDLIAGNPPWIDWKNLPSGYREEIKGLCIDRHLFSGDKRTGGINLNICALIAHVAITNWLSESGRLAFLMPKELAVQQSYQGWRRLEGEPQRGFQQLIDWTAAGHPFDPVKEDFMTYLIGPGKSKEPVPVTHYTKRSRTPKTTTWTTHAAAMEQLEAKQGVAGQIIPESTAFTFAASAEQLNRFRLVAGEAAYKGREGIEFYPQELLLFRYSRPGPKKGLVWLQNIQVQRSKYPIAEQEVLVETRYLFPLVKGPRIKAFEHNYDGLIVPFPYEADDPHRPVSRSMLRQRSPLLLAFYDEWADVLKAQTGFSDSIRGSDPGEFYGLARTGPYSFASCYVAFRDNSRWNACVVTKAKVPWGGSKRLLFQNHAVSICEHPDGTFIDLDEAHYICAILNSHTVSAFITASSDERSFKIRPPVKLPQFNPQNRSHLRLSELSKAAHEGVIEVDEAKAAIDAVYLEL